jgi:hypothetical protein
VNRPERSVGHGTGSRQDGFRGECDEFGLTAFSAAAARSIAAVASSLQTRKTYRYGLSETGSREQAKHVLWLVDAVRLTIGCEHGLGEILVGQIRR